MSKLYYKVVKSRLGKLVSVSAPLSYSIEYEKNRWTKPATDTGGIFVFKDLSDAVRFASYNDEIWKCKVKNPRKLFVRSFIDSMDISYFWKNYFSMRKRHKSTKNMIKDYAVYETPNGTYLASEVMLVEKCQ